MTKSIHSIHSGQVISSSLAQTKSIAKTLAGVVLETQHAKGAMVLALAGELGSGKTAFAQGFAQGLGIKEKITSPTFILIRCYKLQTKNYKLFYHIDCYRLDNPAKELLHLGVKKIMSDPRNIVLIEWADRIKPILPRDTLWVQFEHGDKNKRVISIIW